jgi:hypothetical protein
MDQFDRLNLKYTPANIENGATASQLNKANEFTDSDLINESIANKLLQHLSSVQDFRDRVAAIDYLLDGANKLAGNPQYITNREDLIKDISFIGSSGNIVDFDLFKKAVELVVKGYEDMALIGLTGVAND